MNVVWVFLGGVTMVYAWLFWEQERELRETYDLFGTTGFRDVDHRFREEAVLEHQIAFLETIKEGRGR